MDEITNKLNIILEKIDSLDSRLQVLESDTKDIHQFVPFVGWLHSISEKLTNLPSLAWLQTKEITNSIDTD